jgi:MerR family transcriptional regulator, light-induced transcriptional regulator
MSSQVPWLMPMDCGQNHDLPNSRRQPDKTHPDAVRKSGRPGKKSSERHLLDLARAIETEVIPRLLLAHRSIPAAPVGTPASSDPPSDSEIEELVATALTGNVRSSRLIVETVHSRGVSTEVILERLLAPAARRLGVMWEQDACTFTDVTVGLACLQSALRAATAPNADRHHVDTESRGHRILLLPMVGEHHTFGLAILEEFFRRASWDVLGGYALDEKSLGRIVSSEWLDVVGISASGEALLPKLRGVVDLIRNRSINKQLTVMIGGALINDHPEYLASAGGDCTGIDGKQAVMHALAAVSTRIGRC